MKTVKRGYVPSDEKEFDADHMKIIKSAGEDIFYLLNKGYPIKPVVTFVGDHYLLSERQRMGLTRMTSSAESISNRLKKEIKKNFNEDTVYIDGFNTIITLETAFSGSTLLKCMDGTIRDLAGLRGTYRLIDKTDLAITAIGDELNKFKIKKAIFYLDAPVSNSGRLSQRIIELLENYTFETEAIIINDVDRTLYEKENVITSDAVILDKCKSWINLNKNIIEEKIGRYPYVDISIQNMCEKMPAYLDS